MRGAQADLQGLSPHGILSLMRITDAQTGRSLYQKVRKRFDDEGHARELTFSCFHRYKFLDRDRTRHWFIEALQQVRQEWPVDLWA